MNRGQKAIINTVPAPIGGLNDIDSIAAMPPTDAIEMDNIFPGTSSCTLRGGSVLFATGIGALGETLLVYNGITSKNLFVAAGTQILDITNGGNALLQVSGTSNARFDYVNFGGSSGNHLVAVNGIDLPLYFNGTTWASSGTGFATAITGVDAKLFTQVSSFKDRLYFVQKDSLKCWYLGTNSIGGAANVLDFSGVAKLGGKLVATTRMPSSAGDTLDDYFIAITSEGEVLVYQGTDPASLSTWSFVCNYQAGRPIANGTDMDGSRFIAQFAADMILVTVDGFTTLQGALNNDVVAQERQISRKIVNMVKRDTSQYRHIFGWQILLAPRNTKLLINVPTGSSYYQYVMNTVTGAWCRFTGLEVSAWAYFDDNLYGVIGDASSGGSGNGSSVYTLDVDGDQDFQNTTTYVTYSSYIWTRNDSGVTFNGAPSGVCLSNDGSYIYAAQGGGGGTGGVYKSVDGGITWSLAKSLNVASDISCSSSGQYILLTNVNNTAWASEGGAWVSNDYGATWTQSFSGDYCLNADVSDEGGRMIFFYATSYPKISSDYGVTWNNCSSFGASSVYTVKISGDGNYVYSLSGMGSGYPRISVFSAATSGAWTQMTGIANAGVDKRDLCVNYDGSIIMICGLAGLIYKSTDNGTTFTQITPVAYNNATSICCDSTGANQATSSLYDAEVFLSNDFGETWTQTKEVIPTSGAYKATGSWNTISISNDGSRLAVVGCTPPADTSRHYVYIGVGA